MIEKSIFKHIITYSNGEKEIFTRNFEKHQNILRQVENFRKNGNSISNFKQYDEYSIEFDRTLPNCHGVIETTHYYLYLEK